MLFNSLSFAIFLPIVFTIYWTTPHKYRWAVLLVSSYYFYMSWNAKYIVLILFTTFISYICAIMAYRSSDSAKRKIALFSALAICLGFLFFFKYIDFFSGVVFDTLNAIAIPVKKPTIAVILPVGISFYTFQTLSYVVDVYRGTTKPEMHFGRYATFISFFPQLVAGPIERPNALLPQILNERKFNYDLASYGLRLMFWGFFKKIIISDTLAGSVNLIFNNVYTYKGLSLIIATVFFAFQIYCDFSGYSDIALGTAKLFSINLNENFKSPYLSASMQEFWKKWHISLSTWFRDYVYIPLGGNRNKANRKWRTYFNLFLTFLISGLWHGANWTFIVWGAVHGFIQCIEKYFWGNKTKRYEKEVISVSKSIRIIAVFIFVCFAWIFFRASSLQDAVYIILHMFDGLKEPFVYITQGYRDIGIGRSGFLKIALLILALLTYDSLSLRHNLLIKISELPIFMRWTIYYASIICCLILFPGNSSEFIYFAF